ncbi:MAG: hypothetical protein HYW28_06310 [Rhodospirillales bacterium]|nr:hypothetical protein [Rhodospirillales bacterium]
MAELFPLGASLANLATAAAAPNFELQFSQLQNTIIRRVNTEIARVNNTGASKRFEIEKLQKDGLKLADALPLIQAYREGNNNNLGQIELLQEDAAALAASLGTDDVDQAEVDAFNAQRDLIVEKLDNLFIFIHPDVVDGKAVQFLKEQVDTLNALTPVVGTQADNQAVINAVATFQDQLDTAFTVTQNTVDVALRLELGIQRKQAEVLTEFEELTTVEQARKAQEIENIKIDFANLLTAISLTFEANKSFAQELNKFLTPFVPEPGSILNIFT